MSYVVKEIFYTLQGEGLHAGRPAVFCRFAGCNLWSGREDERAAAACTFCDTDFVGIDGPGGGRFAGARALADAVRSKWPATPPWSPWFPNSSLGTSSSLGSRAGSHVQPFVVCTGGEPLLQMDDNLVQALDRAGFEIAIETNGTLLPPAGIDWVCMSPKAGTNVVLRAGDELKLVYPQAGLDPAELLALNFRYFFLQPMDGPERERNTHLALEYCLAHPPWRLSLQRHKIWGIP